MLPHPRPAVGRPGGGAIVEELHAHRHVAPGGGGGADRDDGAGAGLRDERGRDPRAGLDVTAASREGRPGAALVLSPEERLGYLGRVGGPAARFAGLQRIAHAPYCRSVTEARGLVEAELARIRADDWTTTVRRLDDPAPCVAITIDGDRRQVAILQLAKGPAPSPAVAARSHAWAAVHAAFRAQSPGWPARGCPDPAATLATVRRAVRGTALANVPIVVQSGTSVPGVAFNATLRCADIALSLNGERVEYIALVPEVPAGTLYPTEDALRALAASPNEDFGLPIPPAS